jgi:cytochrome c5
MIRRKPRPTPLAHHGSMRAPPLAALFVAALASGFATPPAAHAQAAGASATPPARIEQPAPTRGRLLYETHCIACHNSQMHWRDKRIVRDWPGLVEQVRAWQERAKLQWSEADILEVARHLNEAIYRLPQAGRG